MGILYNLLLRNPLNVLVQIANKMGLQKKNTDTTIIVGVLHNLSIISSNMDLTLREKYSTEFCMKLIAVISHDNYYSQFCHPLL
jgi:hypothetical protein